MNCFLWVMSIARLRPGVGEQLWFSSVDGWSSLVPFPTGKFVCWRVLSSCLCQHIPALFCNTLPNTYKTGQQGFAHLLLTNPQKCLVKKMIFNKIPVGKGPVETGILSCRGGPASHLSFSKLRLLEKLGPSLLLASERV